MVSKTFKTSNMQGVSCQLEPYRNDLMSWTCRWDSASSVSITGLNK